LEGAADAQVADLVRFEAFDAGAFEQDIAGGDGKKVVDAIEDGGLA
jgi:hypothetical protein